MLNLPSIPTFSSLIFFFSFTNDTATPFLEEEEEEEAKRWNTKMAVDRCSKGRGEPVLPINHNIDDASATSRISPPSFPGRGRGGDITCRYSAAYWSRTRHATCGRRSVSVETAARCSPRAAKRRWRRSRSNTTRYTLSGMYKRMTSCVFTARIYLLSHLLLLSYNNNNLIARCIVVANFFPSRHKILGSQKLPLSFLRFRGTN